MRKLGSKVQPQTPLVSDESASWQEHTQLSRWIFLPRSVTLTFNMAYRKSKMVPFFVFDYLNTTNIHKNSTSCVKATIFCTPKARSDFLCTDSSWYQKHHSSKASKPVWCSAVSPLLVASQVAIPHLQYHQAYEGNTGVFSLDYPPLARSAKRCTICG